MLQAISGYLDTPWLSTLRNVQTTTTTTPHTTSPLPGLALVAASTAISIVTATTSPALSSLVIAVVLGMAFGNFTRTPERYQVGLSIAAKRLLRIGVALLGLRLSVSHVVDLGAVPLLVVASTVVATFFGTQWVGKRLGLSRDLSLLVATGYSICGASAIAAVEGSTDATEEATAAALGLVAVAGTTAIFVLPWLAAMLGLDDAAFGAWAGASIHDVGQVVAAASASQTALTAAIVVKLTRVVLLAPLIAGVNITRRHEEGRNSAPLLPLFVIGFLIAVGIRSSGVLQAPVLDTARWIESGLLTAAMVGLGSAVRFDRLRTLGPRPLLLGAIAWIIVAGVSLVGVTAIG